MDIGLWWSAVVCGNEADPAWPSETVSLLVVGLVNVRVKFRVSIQVGVRLPTTTRQ